jgi:hypothetical protein
MVAVLTIEVNGSRINYRSNGANQMPNRFEIIWPEHKWVSAAQIKVWYEDACANCEADETELNDVEEMARELDSIGHITLGKGRG